MPFPENGEPNPLNQNKASTHARSDPVRTHLLPSSSIDFTKLSVFGRRNGESGDNISRPIGISQNVYVGLSHPESEPPQFSPTELPSRRKPNQNPRLRERCRPGAPEEGPVLGWRREVTRPTWTLHASFCAYALAFAYASYATWHASRIAVLKSEESDSFKPFHKSLNIGGILNFDY